MQCALHKKTLLKTIIRYKREQFAVQGSNYLMRGIGMRIFHKMVQGPFKMGGHAMAQLVEALRYKSEGRGFPCRWCHWNFTLT